MKISKVKTIPFLRRSRRDRRELYVRLRWDIRKYAGTYGGLFVSDMQLPEGKEESLPQWFDFCFLGLDGFKIWNATVVTARLAFEEAVEAKAWDGLSDHARLPTSDHVHTDVDECGCGSDDDRSDALYDLMSRIAREEPPEIRESITVDPCSEYGIGLDGVLHVDGIDRGVIEVFIRRFLEGCESPWVSDRVVPVSELLPEDCDFRLHSFNQPIAMRPWGRLNNGAVLPL